MNILQNLLQTSRLQYKQLLNKLLFLFSDEVYYIGSSETLPPPLMAEEEATLLEQLLHEPENETLKNTLIERNLRLVVYIARKFENTNVCMDDLISIGSIGLIKAINTFNPAKNIKLATYASRCIENEILMHLRKTSNLKTEISIDEPLNVDWDGNELLLSDILGTDNDIINKNLDEETDRQLLFYAMSKLGKRDAFRFKRHRRTHAKGGCGFAGHFAILHFSVGKENHFAFKKRNFKAFLAYSGKFLSKIHTRLCTAT